MATATDLLEPWRDRLSRDLHPFADPRTEVRVETVGRQLVASWTQRQNARRITIEGVLEGEIRVKEGSAVASYAGFFAGSSMGDLTGLAKMMLQAQQRDTLFVRTKARIKNGSAEQAPNGDAVQLIKAEAQEKEQYDGTRLLVITGEPGAGKTRVLQEMVRSTALDYLEGRSTFLFLYINAQGRALARFNEALATELQDLRSLLTYHAVSTLVRLGLVIPIVDGFDELLGTGGYEDAFSSLSDFLEELDGLGALVASARSSYYEHEFLARANRVSSLGAQAWTQRPIEITAWSEEEFEEYIDYTCKRALENAAASAAAAQKIRGLFRLYPALRTKPFFVARITDLVIAGTEFSETGSVLERLVEAYLGREQREKLLDRTGKPLLAMDQLRQLYVELAEEMWNQETRQLDARSVKELAELVLTGTDAPSASLQVVVERMPTMALLSNGSKRGSVSFEHETFFNYFLSARVTDRVLADTYPLERLFGRAVLSEEVAEQTAHAVENVSPEELQRLLSKLATAVHKATFNQQVVRESGGVLMLWLLKSLPHFSSGTSFSISDLIVPGGKLGAVTLRNIDFSRIEFRRVDFGGTQVEACRCSEALFVEISVDPATRLDLSHTVRLEDFRGLWVYSTSGQRLTYEPTEVQTALQNTGALVVNERLAFRPVLPEVVRLLDVLARAYLRSNPITLENDKLVALKRSSQWPLVEDLLVKHDILVREGRDTGGNKKTFLRRRLDIWTVLQGQIRDTAEDPRVTAFWNDLERAFPMKPS